MNFKHPYIVVAILVLVGIPLTLRAAMSSSNYQIIIDSLNTGGGNSVSSSYMNESTVGEVATGESESETYAVKAGYQQMVSTSISITSAADINLGSISGMTASSATGSAAWNVKTDNPAGYSLSVQASTSPALKSAGDASFADYAPGGTPSFAFTVSSGTSAFGFTPEGSDIATAYKDDGAACNTGSGDTADKCWDGFSTSPKIIATRTSASTPNGATTTLKVRAEVGSSYLQEAGAYTAELTVTAVEL